MIDWNEIRIPFKTTAVNWLAELHGEYAASVDLTQYGLTLGSREIIYNENGQPQICDLNHPWNSLPSSFGSMACKVFDRGCGTYSLPHVIIKASPAKLLQGHNVFGPEDPGEGVAHMLALLSSAYPAVYDDLDIMNADIRFTDFTYFARADSHSKANEILHFMRPVSSGQIRPSVANFATTIYFNKASRLIDRKAYLKKEELAVEIQKSKLKYRRGAINKEQLSVLEDKRLMDFTESMIRFEARYSARKLDRLGIPTNLVKYVKYAKAFKNEKGKTLTQHLWECAFKELFKAFEGMTMSKIDNESVKDRIYAKLVVIDKNGKINRRAANAVWRTYESIKYNGYVRTKKIMASSTLHIHVKHLGSCGLSRSFLQNLEPNSPINVVPFVRFVEINFGQQKPNWYQEPVSSFRSKPKLRSVA